MQNAFYKPFYFPRKKDAIFPLFPYTKSNQNLFLRNERETSELFVKSIYAEHWDNVIELLSDSLKNEDLDILKNIFLNEEVYKVIPFQLESRHNVQFYTNSLYASGSGQVLHIHLAKESDGWKIIGVEKES